jgi:uracil-DNA glycosylase
MFPNQNFNDLIFNDQILYGKPAYILPHPSPLNMRWLKNNPEFELKRIKEIRKVIYKTLNI